MPAVFLNVLRMCLLVLWVLLGGLAAVHAESASEPVSNEAVEKLQDRVVELEKETAVLKAELGAKIDAQDKRIADGIGLHGAKVTAQTSFLGGLITLVTILLAFGGFFSFSQAAKNAVAAARAEVIKESESWFAENDGKLRKEIDLLEAEASQARNAIGEHKEGVANVAKEATAEIEKAKASFKFDNDPSSFGQPVVTQQRMQTLENKPRAEWCAEDFRLQALESFASKDYEATLKAVSAEVQLLDGSSHIDDEVKLARALFNKGVTLGLLNRPKEAITAYNKVVERFGTRSEPALLESVAKALINKGVDLEQINLPEEAIAVYDEVVRRFGTRSEPALLEPVANALDNKGITLAQLNRPEEEIAVYDDVVQRFGTRSEPAFLKSVAKVLLNKGITLGQLNRPEEEIAVYNEVVQRFGTHSEPELLEQVAKALVYKGITLGQLKRPEEEIAVYHEVVQRFGTRSEPELLEQVAKALVNKGIILGQLKRPEEEIAVYNEVVQRFGTHSEPELLEPVAKARELLALLMGEQN